MPTVLRVRGYRFYFYSHEPNEPPHVHIDRAGASVKIWLEPIAVARNSGSTPAELAELVRLAQQSVVHQFEFSPCHSGTARRAGPGMTTIVEFQTETLPSNLMFCGWRLGMRSSAEIAPDIRVRDARVEGENLVVDLMDGRTISAPLAWYPRLLAANPEQRRRWEIAGGGYGIHWPDIDEDLSTEGLLRGAPAPRRQFALGGAHRTEG